MMAPLTKESEESAYRVKEDPTVPSIDTGAPMAGSDTGVTKISTTDHPTQKEQIANRPTVDNQRIGTQNFDHPLPSQTPIGLQQDGVGSMYSSRC